MDADGTEVKASHACLHPSIGVRGSLCSEIFLTGSKDNHIQLLVRPNSSLSLPAEPCGQTAAQSACHSVCDVFGRSLRVTGTIPAIAVVEKVWLSNQRQPAEVTLPGLPPSPTI